MDLSKHRGAVPFLNATTLGKVTREWTVPASIDSIVRTTVTSLLVSLVVASIVLVHRLRSNAAAAQIMAVNGHNGGTSAAFMELIRNRRSSAHPHEKPRKWILTLLFVFGVLSYHAGVYVFSALIQQTDTSVISVSEVPIRLRRVARQSIRADYGCVNKGLRFRNGQSDLSISLCHLFPIPTLYARECLGFVRRNVEGMYGIYHPRQIKVAGIPIPGTVPLGPMVVTGNLRLFEWGSLPILETKIDPDLIRNLFADLMPENATIERLQYDDFDGGALCAEKVPIEAREFLNELVGGLGFDEGTSRIVDPLFHSMTLDVVVSASRTSLQTVVFIGIGAFVGHLIVGVLSMFLDKRQGGSPSAVTTVALSHVSGCDSNMPAAVSNGGSHLRIEKVGEGDESSLVLRSIAVVPD